MNFECDDEDEGDYGVFGGTSYKPYFPESERDKQLREYWEQRRFQEERTSRDFNSHMIYLFNK